MKIVDIANEIYVESGQPTTTSIPAIAFWIRAKVGEVNNLLLEDFEIDEDTKEILNANGDEIDIQSVSIFKKLYKIYDYEVSIRTHMSAVSTDTILEVADQGSSVKKINRNEVSKTLANLKKEEELSLKTLVQSYRQRLAIPSQVAGDDSVIGNYPNDSVLDYRLF
jgi:hypothetical protein